MKSITTFWLKVSISILLLFCSSLQTFAVEGIQELQPYNVWLDGLTIHRTSMSPEANNLGWAIKENGLVELGRNALNETSYTYYRNRAGIDFVVYLDCWKNSRYARTSNTIGYRVGVDYKGPIISSEIAEVTVVNTPYEYQITATGAPHKLYAENLPDGLAVDSNGLIKGVPTQTGKYLITLYAENNRDWTTGTLRLDVVSGNNGGGLFNYYTLVLDENLVVTRNHGDGPYGGGLTWIVKQEGVQKLARNALSETRYQYYGNFSGYTYTIHLEYMSQRCSNIVTYNTATPVYNVSITSASSHSGVMGTDISPYTIQTDRACDAYSAAGLPSGLTVTQSGTIVGLPTEYGSFPVKVSASGSYGVAEKTVTFNIQQGSDDYTTKYSISIDSDHVVTRTAGEHPGLVWVVRVNGNHEVVRRSAEGETTFLYSSGTESEHVQIHLEAWIDGKFRPVSNTVVYRSNGVLSQQPVISMDESYSGHVGSAIEAISVQVTGDPTSIDVNGLPPGLSFNQTSNLIEGTPTASGTFTTSITAINAYGVALLSLEFEIVPETQVALEDLFQLSVLSGYNVMRTFGTAESLRWVVYRNGQRVYEYPDTSKTKFNYNRHNEEGEFVVFLEACVEGEFVRVSNFVGYRTLSTDNGPVLKNDRTFTILSGDSVDIELQATGNPSLFEADGLPAGLVLNSSSGRITGTTTQIGDITTLLYITGVNGVSETAVVFQVRQSLSYDQYLGMYLLEIDDLNRFTRSQGDDHKLTWIISKDGEVVLRRNAKNELTYTYNKNYDPGVYTCYLQAYVDSDFRQVSNTIEYTVEADSDFSENGFPNLVEHAMGTRAGTEPHHTTPDLIKINTEGGLTYLTYRYSVNTDASDVCLFVESAKKLGEWSRSAPVSVAVVSGDEHHEVRDVLFCIESDRGFLRLVAELVE
ncbi:MAG: Ig domain-containing protein [Kiritimatiellae bacterium]|nr:Ig domain-containing protein [Kiritimatiellia bacterium]